MSCDWQILLGDNRQTLRTLPAASVDCCVTSPPYYGLRKYSDHNEEIGREQTPEQYLAALLEVFREVRRVLKPSGSVWVNLGDSYGTGGGGQNGKAECGGKTASPQHGSIKSPGVPGFDGQLLGIPWRFALAMQADGWTLRSDIIWAKGLSFCESYSGACMPQSMRGTRWERCWAKVAGTARRISTLVGTGNAENPPEGNSHDPGRPEGLDRQLCPGCPKCEPNGGYVLRRGQWRPTTGHEYLFLFTLGGAVLDCEAVREKANTGGAVGFGGNGSAVGMGVTPTGNMDPERRKHYVTPTARNLRTVWAINTEPSPERHYAMFPRKLIRPIVTVATSARGCCPTCGAPWARVVETEQLKRERPNEYTKRHHEQDGTGNACANDVAGAASRTIGFRPICDCNAIDVAPSVVLDPFHGGGTTGIVCDELSEGYLAKDGPRPLRYVGCELNADYLPIGEARRERFRLKRAERGTKPKKTKRVAAALGQMELFS